MHGSQGGAGVGPSRPLSPRSHHFIVVSDTRACETGISQYRCAARNCRNELARDSAPQMPDDCRQQSWSTNKERRFAGASTSA